MISYWWSCFILWLIRPRWITTDYDETKGPNYEIDEGNFGVKFLGGRFIYYKGTEPLVLLNKTRKVFRKEFGHTIYPRPDHRLKEE
jgi:hypothetical protein